MPQNSLFHLICKIAGDELGYDMADMKEIFRRRFLIPKTVKIGNETLEIYPSTTSLSKGQFHELIEDCLRLCAELNITINTKEYNFNGVQ